jgi:hypothetical protein
MSYVYTVGSRRLELPTSSVSRKRRSFNCNTTARKLFILRKTVGAFIGRFDVNWALMGAELGTGKRASGAPVSMNVQPIQVTSALARSDLPLLPVVTQVISV